MVISSPWAPDVPPSVVARAQERSASGAIVANNTRIQQLRDSIALKRFRAEECQRKLDEGATRARNEGVTGIGKEFTYDYYLSWIKVQAGRGDSNLRPQNGLANLTRRRVLDVQAQLLLDISKDEAALKALGATEGSGGGGATGEKEIAPPANYSPTVNYNASSVKESYFYTGMSFVNKADPNWRGGRGATDKFDSFIWSGNTPRKVDDANQLWNEALTSNSKGMIQTWNPPGGRGSYVNPSNSNFTTLSSASSVQRYGFQFLYNPTTIEMSYGGVADVDPGMQSSGTEEFLLSNPSVFQSSIGLQVIINRMFDFQYINENGIKQGQISDFYAGNIPTNADLKVIYNKGTMYDIEYLLQTMFPFEPYDSQLRGKTSDIGFLGASPVELHLGKSLRYVAQINNINVNHVIFDNRMVPLFTTISVSTNRIPDYQGNNS
jgi:hypothetical protein